MGKNKRRVKESPKDSFYACLPVQEPESDVVDPGVLASVLSAEYTLIDPSLVHAILLDYDPETLGQHVDEIRDQLAVLEATSVPDTDAVAADAACTPPLSGRVSPLHSVFATSNGNWTAPSSNSTPAQSLFSDDDADPQTEAELLVAFFPSLPRRSIDEALSSNHSLEAAIDHLLSVELITGVQRTGRWEDEPGELADEREFSPVTSRRGSASLKTDTATPKSTVKQPQPKAKKAKARTIPVVDTMQRRATPVSRTTSEGGGGARAPSGVPSSDVWSAFASLAVFLADIVPTGSANYFTSYLHSPDYMCAHEAAIAALKALAASSSVAPDIQGVAILEDMYGLSLVDHEEDIAGETLSICVRATGGDIGSVMDLMDMLSDLTWWPDYENARENERDPFDTLANLSAALPKKTAPAQVVAEPESHTTRAVNANRLARPVSEGGKKREERVVPGSKPPPSAAAFPSANGHSLPGSAPWVTARQRSAAKNPNNVPWQTVAPTRRNTARGAHPLAASIPAYARGVLPQNKTPGALARANAAEHSTISADDCYARGAEQWRKREAAIREAGRHFKSSGRRDTAAMVASHYASTARAAMESARAWEMRGARMVVDSQMSRSSGHVVDLHYATVEQAVTLALEAAETWWRTAQRTREDSLNTGAAAPQPLVIVTGKGRHSAGNVGVLGPAVARALTDAGWRIDRGEGYVAVKAGAY